MGTSRIRALGWVFIGATLLLLLRLHRVQIVDGPRHQERALETAERTLDLPALRGTIRDRRGRLLARDAERCQVHVIPSRFRERALLHAVADLLWLLDPPAASRAETQAVVADRPMEMAGRLLALPASAPAAGEALAPAFRELLRPEGGLLREEPERELRIREALARLRGGLAPLRRRELARLAGSAGALGPALGLDVRDLARRLNDELRLLEDLGRGLGLAGRDALFTAVLELQERERSWVRAAIEREARDAAALDLLGTARLDGKGASAALRLRLARELGLGPSDPLEAEAALRIHDALLRGSLLAVASEEELAAGASARDAVGVAAGRGLLSTEPEALIGAWWRRTREEPGFDAERHFGSRRRREALARYRAGRDFRLGPRADAALVRPAVVGPGGLEELGFRIELGFARDREVALGHPAGVRLLLGPVSEETGQAVAGASVEGVNDARLRGRPGRLQRTESGEVRIEALPRHGTDLALALDLELCRGLEEILRRAAFDDPAAIAVVDVGTGAVVGAATWPLAEDPGSALAERLRLEEEKAWLLRLAQSGPGPATQRLWALRADPDPSPAAKRELEFLRHALASPDAFVAARRAEVNRALARSPAFHRAVETAEHLPPGSVFKAVTLLAGLEARVVEPEEAISCTGTTRRAFHRCHDHGEGINLVRALQKSCNEYCYMVADRLGTEALVAFHERIGLFAEIPGLLPAMPAARRAELEDHRRSLAIGGGSILCVPVRAAAIAASLALGRRVQPWMVGPPAAPDPGPSLAPQASLSWVRRGMRAVVQAGGTAGRHERALQAFRIAAKTGTADYIAAGGERLNQAWFVGYAPADPSDHPRLAFAIVQTNTRDAGASVAGLAAAVCEAFAITDPEGPWW
jgi:cell division protein FtsI/penicillin-binding protein 2